MTTRQLNRLFHQMADAAGIGCTATKRMIYSSAARGP